MRVLSYKFSCVWFVPDLPHLPQEFCAYKLVPRVFDNVVREYWFHASKRPGLSLWSEQSYFGRRINEIFMMPGRKVYVVGVGMTKVKYTLIIFRWIWSQISSRKLQVCPLTLWLVCNDYSAKYCPVTINAYQAIKTRGLIAKVTIISISNREKKCVQWVFRVFSSQLGCTRLSGDPKKRRFIFCPTPPGPRPVPFLNCNLHSRSRNWKAPV